MYKAFVRAKSGCDKWHDYEMSVAPYETDKPIYYEFTACPAAEFGIRHGLTDIMPALCNVDFASMELLCACLLYTSNGSPMPTSFTRSAGNRKTITSSTAYFRYVSGLSFFVESFFVGRCV